MLPFVLPINRLFTAVSLSLILFSVWKREAAKMMNLCKKSLNTILGISDDDKRLKDNDDGDGGLRSSLRRKDDDGGGRCASLNPCSSLHRSRSLPCLQARTQGLSMITTEVEKNRNVLESSALRSPASLGPKTTSTLGFRHGDVECSSGLNHCTEGLGCESSDVMEAAGTPPRRGNGDGESEVARRERVYLEKRSTRKMIARLRLQAELPPPLPWLSTNGHPSFFLRPERRNGRIRLAQMKIYHHDVFLANRENGRLTLRLLGKKPETGVSSTENKALHAEEETLPELIDEEEEEEECNKNVLNHHESENPNVVGNTPENHLLDNGHEGVEVVKEQCNEEKEELENPHESVVHDLRDDEERTDGVAQNRHLLPSSWRCYDRGERDDFWNHRYVTTT